MENAISIATNTLMPHGLTNMSGVLKEQDFFALPSETIINLMDELSEDSLYWATKTLLKRKAKEDLIWQVYCLKKLILMKQSKFIDLSFTGLKEVDSLQDIIKKFIKGKVGEAQFYGLLCFAVSCDFSLPSELVKHLVVTHQLYHWAPLLDETQRIHCFEKLLKNADTDKKYINLIYLLSKDKEKFPLEIRQIIDELLKKYPVFFVKRKNYTAHQDHLILLKVLPVLMLHLNHQRHQEVMELLLPKLNDPEPRIREASLKIIASCIPFLKTQNNELLFNALRLKLNDKKAIVRQAAQNAITKCMPYFESHSKNNAAYTGSMKEQSFEPGITDTASSQDEQAITETLLQNLNDDKWLTRHETVQIITAHIPYFKDFKSSEIIHFIQDKLSHENWRVRKRILELLVIGIPYLNGIHQAILDKVMAQLDDEYWKIREMAVKITAECMPFASKEKFQDALTMLLLHLNDNNWLVRDAILTAVDRFFFFPMVNQSRVLQQLLPQLLDDDWSNRYVILHALHLIVPHLLPENHSSVLDAILLKANDPNSIIRGMALQVVTLLIPFLQNKHHQQVLEAILPKLNDKNSYVCTMSRKAVIELIACLNQEHHQSILEVIFVRLNDSDDSVREAGLQDVALCIPHLSDEWRTHVFNKILHLLHDRSGKVSCAAIQALIACVPYLSGVCFVEAAHAIFPKLQNEQWEICDAAAKALLVCGLYLNNEMHDLFHEQLRNYFFENSLIAWCDKFYDEILPKDLEM